MGFNKARRHKAPIEVDDLRVCLDRRGYFCNFSFIESDVEKFPRSVRQICPLENQVHEFTICKVARVTRGWQGIGAGMKAISMTP